MASKILYLNLSSIQEMTKHNFLDGLMSSNRQRTYVIIVLLDNIKGRYFYLQIFERQDHGNQFLVIFEGLSHHQYSAETSISFLNVDDFFTLKWVSLITSLMLSMLLRISSFV